MPFALLLAVTPAAALLVGALLSWRIPRPLARVASGASIGAACVALGGAIALGWWTWRLPSAAQFTLSPWFRVLVEEGPALQVDRLSAVCLVLIAGLALVAAVRGRASGDTRALAGPMLVAAASALFVVAADAPLGLVFAWLVLDVTLVLVGDTSPAVIVVNQVGLVMALAGLVGLPFDAAEGSRLGLASIADMNRAWLLGAAAVRMGLYPLWWALPRTAPERAWRACGSRLAPTVAGAYLVLQITESTRLGEGLNFRTLAPALVATFGGALLAWMAANRAASLDWQATFHASLIVMAASVGGAVGQAVALVFLVDLVLTRSALYAAEGLAATRPVRLSRWLLAASAAGVPPTLGFAGRWLMYRELLASDMGIVLFLTVVAGALATMALFEGVRVHAPVGRANRSAVGTVLVLAVAGVALGPVLAKAPFATLAGTTLPSALTDLWATVRNPLTRATTGVTLVAAILVPVLLAAVVRRPPNALGGTRRQVSRRVLELGDVLEWGTRAMLRAGAWFHQGTGLLESQRAMSWTLMAGAVAGAAMVASAPPTAAASELPIARDAVGFGVAAIVAAVMLLSAAPVTALIALASGDVIAAAVMASAGVPVPITAIKIIVGALVLGILAISVAQTPSEHHLAGAARRLRSLRGEQPDEAHRWVAAFALAASLIAAFGIQSITLPAALPPGALAPALALMGGGILTAVFARDALRVSAGVLLALTGFEAAYTLIDSGLVITGGIAAFQLLFAVVASYHVGLPATDQAS